MADGDPAQAMSEALAKVDQAAKAFQAARKAHNDADAEFQRLHKVWIETEGKGEREAYQQAVAATAAARERENRAFEALAAAITKFLDALRQWVSSVVPPAP